MGLLDKLIKSLEVLTAWAEKTERAQAAKGKKPASAKPVAPAARIRIQKPTATNGKPKEAAEKPAAKGKPAAKTQKAAVPPEAKKNAKTAAQQSSQMAAKQSSQMAAPAKNAGKKPGAKTRAAASRKKGAKQAASPAPAPAPKSTGVYVGLVTHYFPHVNAAAVKIEEGVLSVGDRIHIVGHTTDFKQKILSLQIDRKSVQAGRQGEEVGIETKDRVRTDDKVYKVT